MKPKTIKILYWSITILFALFFLVDGAMGIMQVEEGQEIMRHLGYPVYVLTILGVAKVSGAIALLQTKYSLLREWAYAGFTFHFLGACLSRAFAGDSAGLVLSPLLFMGVMFLSYYLWKRTAKAGKLAFA
ncbi:DoxX family protein [Cesiribacter sp. SM1]|uniref:DoxX family protein n=1 Tax=Cesiribacter sp. SM1 TaxID=2861196 RepID=UPI001CD55B2E|nr:DoxX family protein [Cesiribacter sp. SM1]